MFSAVKVLILEVRGVVSIVIIVLLEVVPKPAPLLGTGGGCATFHNHLALNRCSIVEHLINARVFSITKCRKSPRGGEITVTVNQNEYPSVVSKLRIILQCSRNQH